MALKALSNDARRPQDLVDIGALLREAGPDELDNARQAAALITERGFGRGKDVRVELEAFLRPGS